MEKILKIVQCSECRHLTPVSYGYSAQNQRFFVCEKTGSRMSMSAVYYRINPDCPLPDAQEGGQS